MIQLESKLTQYEDNSRRELERRMELEALIREKDLDITRLYGEIAVLKRDNVSIRGEVGHLHNKLI